MFALQYSQFGPPGVLGVGEAEAPHAGPGEVRIAVRASGVTPSDGKLRAGALGDRALKWPHIPGMDAAGVVDEVGAGVTGTALGDAVFGLVDIARLGGAAAEFAVLTAWAAKPDAFSWEQAGAAASGIETSTRVLDALRVTAGTTLLIDGAAGGVGSAAVQLAAARGATVIGTASQANHAFLAGLGATPTVYGPGLAERVAALAPGGVDAVLDAAGAGSLPDLVAIAGDADRVVTIADMHAHDHGVRLSHTAPGSTATPGYAGLPLAASLAAQGRFTVPLYAVFALVDAARAHELSATGHARGKIVLTVP
ncbi:NADP-dependent oxidoreductase [Streptantibioticus silvisoli]|uniref:NADP-dependent oxidoreductase n=1 Tax=Streptantibioticus silvisoli TaxID=2705255 RepID=A0ABT6W378_9ACTN|nr:NADP-dependent oxidoreductase [Streptantibioticus silvisoli]MDI5965165.1 NADP-dependent oxidoreductase [Streptantibioticus silvisoli]